MSDKDTTEQPTQRPESFESLDEALSGKDNWHRDLVNRLAFAAVNEQRRARRWNVFFKCLLALYLGALLLLYWPAEWPAMEKTGEKHTALVEMRGVISDETEANAETVIEGLQDAFADSKTAGVILRLNSPGGSPVQSRYIYNEIKRLREENADTPLYAVVTDICASGCYYVAAAAADIYVDSASIIGSIGVRMDSFGFVDSMKKLGVERRLYTAGENKGFLDPFSPSKHSDVEHINKLLGDIHEQFKVAVREGRGDRLQDESQIYSGLIWTGDESIELGLVDAIGSSSYVAREIIGAEDIVEFTKEPDLFERLSDRIGVAIARSLGDIIHSGANSIR
ncbi:MAG: S49 family peptidase [Gammaproteobacteria bacterium]|nr:MAG: S49 family peptidase [Gammaproteobacteria bacterium]